VLAGVFASADFNPNLDINLKPFLGTTLWIEQVKAIGLILALSVVATIVLYYLINATIGCRSDVDEETQGLDLADHGEEGYID
jgi:Amt family ammonium transporter